MLNQAATDRIELARLLNISDLQLSYITNVDAGHGLIKVGSSLVPFENKFPKNTKLYKLMTTKPGEGLEEPRKPALGKSSAASSPESDLLTDQELRILEKIREVAKSQEEFDALRKKLSHNLSMELDNNRTVISHMLEQSIVTAYSSLIYTGISR